MENNDRKNEKLLLDMAKEIEQKNKTVWRSMWVILIVSITGLLLFMAAAALLIQCPKCGKRTWCKKVLKK